MPKRKSEDIISHYDKQFKKMKQKMEEDLRRANSENEDLGQSSDGTLTPNQVEKEEKMLEREANLAEEAPKLERLQKEEKDKLKEQKAKEREDKKRLEKERPDLTRPDPGPRGRGRGAGGARPSAAGDTDESLSKLVGIKIKDLGQSPDGTPTPNQIEKDKKRLEREAKLAKKEARKLERQQKKEEKDKLKEQKAKEREDKRMAPLALQDSKWLEKERPDAGAVPGFQVAPLYPPDESLHQAATDTNLELDPEMRLALGDPAEDTPIYGENIHADIAQRWEPLLRKGLTKEIKEKLSKEHNVPDNCRLLKAPSLNSEFAEGIANGVRAADSNIERQQSQLGLGITAISKAMSTLIKDEKNVDVIKLLQEGCRLLCDLHYAETETRKRLIKRRLDKSFTTSWIIHDEERDDTLFGRNCLRRLKQQNHRENHLTEFDSRETGQTLLDIPRRTGGGQGGTYTPSRSTPTTSYQRIQTPTTYTAPPPPSPPPPQAGPQVRQQSVRGRSPTRH